MSDEKKIIDIGTLTDEQIYERLLRQMPHKKYWLGFEIRPGLAALILEKLNTGNRTQKPKAVAQYMSYMMAHDWQITGQAIIFSEEGRLLDGQNRLMACVQSGVPFKTDVRFGIANDAFTFLDQGKMRSGGDILHIAGYVNANRLSRAVRWAYLIDENKVKSRESPDKPFILRLAQERYHDLPPFIPLGTAVYKVSGQPDGLVAALLYHFARANRDKADAFAAAWASGKWDGKYGCIGKMQKEVARLGTSANGRVHDVVRAAVIVLAWNKFVSGKVGTEADYQWSLGDDFPEISK